MVGAHANMFPHGSRKPVLIFSVFFGSLALAGAVFFAVAGAGIYGSPFAGDAYFNFTLLLVLLCGPVMILPCTILDSFRPGVGGFTLCGMAVVEIVVIALNNIQQWGFAVHAAALGSLCLALPMFVIGTALFLSVNQQVSRLNWLWRLELLLVAAAAGVFSWQVGADGFDALLNWLRGGTI